MPDRELPEETPVDDPEAVRVFSLLPDVDIDEAVCARHQLPMIEYGIVVRTDGAEYRVADGFHAFSCPPCAEEMTEMVEEGDEGDLSVSDVIRYYSGKYFMVWDRGDAPGEWFKYTGEAEYDGDVGVAITKPENPAVVFFGEGV